MPTSEWKAATSCGIAVMAILRAITAPIAPPTPSPIATSAQPIPSEGGEAASVVRMAIAIPTMPNRFPCRDVSGLDSPRSARTNRTPAAR